MGQQDKEAYSLKAGEPRGSEGKEKKKIEVLWASPRLLDRGEGVQFFIARHAGSIRGGKLGGRKKKRGVRHLSEKRPRE